MRLLIFSFLLTFLSQVYVKAQSHSLSVHIQNANSDQGKILVLVFNQKEGFPDAVDKAFKNYVLTPKNKQAQLVIENLSLGEYAISVFHDEDGNGVMNTNLIGLPQEKYGFSNNPKIFFGPPSFDKAAVQIGTEHRSIKIQLH
jgi:uncharacterized protein (DUF2141 family)